MPDWNEITRRWSQAQQRNSAMAWRAISHWLAAEALVAELEHDQSTVVESLRTASDLAHQHYIDLMPACGEETDTGKD